jgi:hypothetical protein
MRESPPKASTAAHFVSTGISAHPVSRQLKDNRIAVKQLGRGDFMPGRDDQLFGHKLFQVVHFLLPPLRG